MIALLLLSLVAHSVTPPRDHDVVSADAATVAALDGAYGEIVGFHESGGGPLRPGSVNHMRLLDLVPAIDGAKTLTGGRLARGDLGEPGSRFGAMDSVDVVLELELDMGTMVVLSETRTITLGVDMIDPDGQHRVGALHVHPPEAAEVDLELAAPVIEALLDQLDQQEEAYGRTLTRQSQRLLDQTLGCPEGSRHERLAREFGGNVHACIDDKGVRVGPALEGDLYGLLAGIRVTEGNYAAGKRHGTWTYRHTDGSLRATGDYDRDVAVGEWRYRSPVGKTHTVTYAHGADAATGGQVRITGFSAALLAGVAAHEEDAGQPPATGDRVCVRAWAHERGFCGTAFAVTRKHTEVQLTELLLDDFSGTVETLTAHPCSGDRTVTPRLVGQLVNVPHRCL